MMVSFIPFLIDAEESRHNKRKKTRTKSPIRLGNTLQFVLFLDGIGVRRAFCCVDKLVSEALGDGLDIAECGFAGSDCEKRDGLIDSSQGRYVDGLATDGTLRADTRRVFTGAGIHDRIDEDLDGVLVGEEVDDLKGVGDNADGEEFLAVVAALHHQAVYEALDDGHLRFLELLLGVAAGGVREVDGVTDLDVICQGDVLDLNVLCVPFAEELDFLADF